MSVLGSIGAREDAAAGTLPAGGLVNVSSIGFGTEIAVPAAQASIAPAPAAVPTDPLADINSFLSDRKPALTQAQSQELLNQLPQHGDVGPALGLKPIGQLQMETSSMAQGISTKMFDIVSGLDSAVGPNGQPLTGNQKFDRYSEQIVGLAGEIGDSMQGLASEADELNRVVVGITDLAAKDPSKMGQATAVLNRIQMRIERVQVELDKQSEMRKLLLQMAGGNPSKQTIEKLRAMGLGSWVEDVVRQMLKAMRQTTGIPQGVIAALQGAGLGGLVESDSYSLAKDQSRGRQRLEVKGADQHRQIVGQSPADQAKTGAIHVGAPLSQGRTQPDALPVGIGGPSTGTGSPTQNVAHS